MTRIKKISLPIILIAIIVAGVYSYPHVKQFVKNVNFVNHYVAKPLPQTPAEIKTSDIERRMKEVKTRADHIAKVAKFDDTEARREATLEYEKDEAAKYAKIQTDIQTSKDIVKQNEVSF